MAAKKATKIRKQKVESLCRGTITIHVIEHPTPEQQQRWDRTWSKLIETVRPELIEWLKAEELTQKRLPA